jgi:hypothetical protein
MPVVADSVPGAIKSLRLDLENMTQVLDLFETLASLSSFPTEYEEVIESVSGVLDDLNSFKVKMQSANNELRLSSQVNNEKRQTNTSTFSTSLDPAAPTFIPPPKTDVTPELINQSISSQPDNTGLVTGVFPVFGDGIMTFLIQLVGPVAPILPINSSTSFPCGAIGKGPDPKIVVGPKYVQDGTQQTIIADCMVIAVNMYTPTVITYFVMNTEGEVFSLVGSIKVQDLDKINPAAPIALSLQSSSTWDKRSINSPANITIPKRHQIHQIECGVKCTDSGYFITGLDDFCGCMQFDDSGSLNVRSGISAPDMTEATMSAKACAAMTCINNGGKPAVFNPFSLTCWCVDQTYVEDIQGGWAN